MVVIGEQNAEGRIFAGQQAYGPHASAINNRLRALGLRTYSQEEIRRQIAQAEIDAQFRNDPDAALSASKRLGASFVLRGLITSQTNRNPMMRVNQVSVNMDFALTGSNGRLISTAEASSASYAGADVGKMALTLVNEQADEVVAKLYADYCEKAGFAADRQVRKSSQGGAEIELRRVVEPEPHERECRNERSHIFPVRQALLGVAALAGTSLGAGPAAVRQSVADRRRARRRSRRTRPPIRPLYQPVEYVNASKKGPALVVIPGEIKSNNATFVQKFTANNIADFGEIELSSANFQVLERSNLGPVAQGVRARLQPRRSGFGAQDAAHRASSRRPSTS